MLANDLYVTLHAIENPETREYYQGKVMDHKNDLFLYLLSPESTVNEIVEFIDHTNW